MLTTYKAKISTGYVFWDEIDNIRLKDCFVFLEQMMELENMMAKLEKFQITSELLAKLIEKENGRGFPSLKPKCQNILEKIT